MLVVKAAPPGGIFWIQRTGPTKEEKRKPQKGHFIAISPGPSTNALLTKPPKDVVEMDANQGSWKISLYPQLEDKTTDVGWGTVEKDSMYVSISKRKKSILFVGEKIKV